MKPAEKSCHNSDELTKPGHPEADVKQGTIQVKREYIDIYIFDFNKIYIKMKDFS